MAGSSTAPRVQKPYIISSTHAGPVDDKQTVSSIANIGVELPAGVRYKGLFSYVEDIEQYYCFRSGVLDVHFVPMCETAAPPGTGDVKKFVTRSVNLDNGIELSHSLNSMHVVVNVFDSTTLECLDVLYKLGPSFLDMTLPPEDIDLLLNNTITFYAQHRATVDIIILA